MLAVNGYYDGNVCVIKEKVSVQPQEVIITFLNKPFEKSNKRQTAAEEKKFDAAIEDAFGMWKNHDNSVSVDEYVRNMRKGRQFDI